MAGSSTLDPDNFPKAPDRTLGRGHGTGALGPSDSSDSGSDVQGGSGLSQQFDTGLRQGPNDMETGRAGGTAGPDLGDSDLDSDSDSYGTGERAAAGRDTVAPDGADIDVDHIETLPPGILEELDEPEDVERGKGGRRRP
ncbi:hypothetical protein LJR289_003376 [Pseudoduganella sp. LjRoot289]|uniref:hypothetical protein n=1 Tax=Pseudoduganella sp. LjRoot289 TaxID=3342314 RepID=UPI003ECEC206